MFGFFSNLSSKMKFSGAISRYDIEACRQFFFDLRNQQKLNEIFISNKKEISLLEKILNADIENNFKWDYHYHTPLISHLFTCFSSKVEQERVLNFLLSNGKTLQDEILTNPNCYQILASFIANKFISINSHVVYNPQEENSFETTKMLTIIESDNFQAIQMIYNDYPEAFDYIDNFGNTFLPYALFYSTQNTILFLLDRINYTHINRFGLNQVEYAFSLLEQQAKLETISQDKLDRITSNLNRIIVKYNLNINKNPKMLNTVFFQPILRGCSKQYIDVLTKRLKVSLDNLFNGYHLIDICSAQGNIQMCDNLINTIDEINTQNRIPKTFKKTQLNMGTKNNPMRVNFVSSHYLLNESFQSENFQKLFQFFVSNGEILPNETNMYGNGFLHSICSIMQPNDEEAYNTFRFFIEKYDLNPFLTNQDGHFPLEYISDLSHRYNIVEYLEMFYRFSEEKYHSDKKNLEQKLKFTLNYKKALKAYFQEQRTKIASEKLEREMKKGSKKSNKFTIHINEKSNEEKLIAVA